MRAVQFQNITLWLPLQVVPLQIFGRECSKWGKISIHELYVLYVKIPLECMLLNVNSRPHKGTFTCMRENGGPVEHWFRGKTART